MFEFLALALLVVLLILLLTMKSDLQAKLNILHTRIEQLTAELKKLRDPKTDDRKPAEEKTEIPLIIKELKPTIKPLEETKELKQEPKIEIPEKQEIKPPVIQQPVNRPPVVTTPKPPEPRKPGFFERNPDLEKFIGENLANKIGIAVLVLGIGYFVKYAIDQNWIGIYGRVFIGILCGGLLLGLAHWLRKSFAAFSSVLVGGGIAVLYLTISIAFHEYQIFSQTLAFILMVIITGFAIILSITYNRIELAILAILGGFGSPFMVSTGEGNYVVLFTYILILDIGMLVLAYFKKWNLVNIISYIFTVILFSGWLAAEFYGERLVLVNGALIFATLFYLSFFAMNIIHNIKVNTKFKALDVTLLLSNTFLYYAAGMIILSNEYGEMYKGLFTALLGVFNFVFAYLLFKNQRVDRNLIYMLIGLVLTFISLAAPVQLEGNYITLFWAAEAVLLFWLSQKSGIRVMKVGSVVITLLMVISLIMDWQNTYYAITSEFVAMPIILNKPYITGIAVLVSIVLSLFLLRKEKDWVEHILPYRIVLTLCGLGILYASQYLELHYQLNLYFSDNASIVIIIGTYNMLFISGLLLCLTKLIPQDFRREVATLLGVVSIFSFLVFYHTQFVIARDMYLLENGTITGFAFHYIFIALLLFISIVTLRNVQQLSDFNKKSFNIYSWFYVFFFVFLASTELDHVVVLASVTSYENLYHVLEQNHKIGFPILWGIASFILIALGLKTKKRHLRIISLSLLLITLLKLFIFDIRGISEGGKIAAFISLGVLLLVVSFMYQRLKKLLLTDEPEKPTQTENNNTL